MDGDGSTPNDDTGLMARLADGDEAAVRTLYQRYAVAVFALARRILGDHHLAEEATQQAFFQAYKAAATFDASKGSLGAWLYQIGRRAAIDAYRKERRHRGGLPLDGDEAAELAVASPGLESAWERWQIGEAVGGLPPHQRVVIDLCALQGYSHSEAAAQLGLPVGTVKSRLFKAYRALAESLSGLVEITDAI